MKLVAFSGMLCRPLNIQKDGEFKIRGVMNHAKDLPELVRYEHFACKEERDKKFDLLVNKLKEMP